MVEVCPYIALSSGTGSPVRPWMRHDPLDFRAERRHALDYAVDFALGGGELLHDVGGVHVVVPQVLGNRVEGASDLVELVAPMAHLAHELGGGERVYHDKVGGAPADDVIRQLQEHAQEVGGAHALVLCDFVEAFFLLGGHADVDVGRVADYQGSSALVASQCGRARFSGARGLPHKVYAQRCAARAD